MEYFQPVGEVMFEGKSYMAPNNIDNYLFDKFGHNFMTIPKTADRKTHAIKIDFF